MKLWRDAIMLLEHAELFFLGRCYGNSENPERNRRADVDR